MIDPMNMGAVLLSLYPSAHPREDYQVESLGGVTRLARWNVARLGPQPTAAELDAGETSYLAAAPTRAAGAREVAVFADLVRRMESAGWTADMAFARLLTDTITRVPSVSRTARETQFLSAVQAANAAVP